MTERIKIRELIAKEVSSLMAADKFKILKPIRCKSCGYEGIFSRRIFQITGVSRAKWSKHDIQNFLAYHLKKKYGIYYVFFKIYRNNFYVDSAVCSKCDSTMVIFDIDITEDMIAQMSKVTGAPIGKIKKNLDTIISQIDNQ